MTLKEFLVSSFLSLTSAFGIYYIIAYVKERKWTNLVLITLLFVLILVLFIYPPSSKILDNTTFNDIGIHLIIILLLAFLLFLILTYLNTTLVNFNRIKSLFISINDKDISEKIKFWSYYHIEKERIREMDDSIFDINDKQFINHDYLYQLLMPSGYRLYNLTFINQFKSPNNQIGIVHIIHQENYISWIDVIYWRILNYFSNYNIAVHVFVSDEVASNKTFLAYLKRFLGNKVVIDDALFKSLHNIHVEVNDKLEEERLVKREPNYNKLRYFSQLSPLLLSKKHTFILLWEGYYTGYKFYDSILGDDSNFELKSTMQEHPISISLSDYRTEYLIAPTCCGINDKGIKYRIIPEKTFLLGQNSYQDTLNRINDLCNYSLRAISYQVLCSTLPWIERILFKAILGVLIMVRKDRKEGIDASPDWATKVISKIYVFMTQFIHNRIIKNAGL